MVRGSGSDKRIASDSLYDDLQRFGLRVVYGGGFRRTTGAQEVLKPAVSSSVFGHFWGCGQKRPALGGAELPPPEERSERRQWRMQGGERVAAVKISSVRRQDAQKFWAPQQCTFYK